MLTPKGASLLYGLSFIGLVMWVTLNPVYTVASLFLLVLFAVHNLKFRVSVKRLRQLEIERHVEDQVVFVGKTSRVSLVVRNKTGVSLGRIEIRDKIPEGLEIASKSVTQQSRIAGDQPVELEYFLFAKQMGEYEIGGVELAVSDELGLFKHTSVHDVATRLHVFPTVPVSATRLLTSRALRNVLATLAVGERSLRRPGHGTEFHGIREYNPGDEFRSIAWKFVAKSPQYQLMTRESEAEKVLDVIFLVHSQASLLDGGIGGRKLDKVVESALALVFATISEGDRLTVAFEGKLGRITVPGRGRQKQLSQAPRLLYNLRPGRREELFDALRSLEGLRTRRALILIFTDTAEVNEESLHRMRALRMRGHAVHVFIFDTPAFLPHPPEDPSRIRVRQAYTLLSQKQEAIFAGMRSELSKAAVDSHLVGHDNIVEDVMQVYVTAKNRGGLGT